MRESGIHDLAYKNRVDILSFHDMTCINAFVQFSSLFNEAMKYPFKVAMAPGKDGTTKKCAILYGKQIKNELRNEKNSMFVTHDA